LPEQVSTYWARHSYATNAIRNGASMEFIQESLGQGNIKTTQNYIAGFDDDVKKEFSQTLMNFD
jgi:site-specific recombinase XerD